MAAVAFVCVLTSTVIIVSVLAYKKRCGKHAITRRLYYEESMNSKETRLELSQQSQYDTFSKLNHTAAIVQDTDSETSLQSFMQQGSETYYFTSRTTQESSQFVSLASCPAVSV